MTSGPMKCCYKDCAIGGVLDGRIEVKTVLPGSGISSRIKHKFLVNWRPTGEAEFHKTCWDSVYTLSRSRKKTKKGGNGPVIMVAEEKALVKAAAEALEEFDDCDKIMQEAKWAAQWIKAAKHCVAFTGAGISTSAGIGDYRGKAGKWTEEDQNHTVDMETVFSGSHSCTEEPPKKKQKQETILEETEEETEDGVPYEKLRPTYTHEALQKLMSSGYLKFVISQNGDGLHGLSGISSNRLAELHGNVFVEACEICDARYDRKYYVMDDVGSQYYEELEDYGKTDVKKPKYAKKCDMCGLCHRTGRMCEKEGCRGHLKDTIINFRDLLEDDVLDKAWSHSKKCDVMVCLGTTLQVTPAADLVKKMKDRNKLIICNRQETPVDGQFEKKSRDGATKGCRVFGDCDLFVTEVMKHIYPEDELKQWESQRADRMKTYDKKRD